MTVTIHVAGHPAPQNHRRTRSNDSDVTKILKMFSALGLGQSSDQLQMVTIPGPPWSKSRPRFNRRGHTYRPREDVDAETKTATHLSQVIKQQYTGNVGIVCIFYRPNHQRIDTDNLVKHVCDAANGVVWKDDSQCTAIMAVIELDTENPRTVVGIGRHESTLKRGSDDTAPCAVCGNPIPLASRGNRGDRTPRVKTCSRACSAISKGHEILDRQVPCRHCGTMFKRITKTQKLCSEACRADWLRNTKKAAAKPLSRCTDCNEQLTHRRGGRCRQCWRTHVAKQHKAIP